MKAIQIKQAGGIEQLYSVELPIPELGPTDVLVQLKATGINFIDIYMRTGLYKSPRYPFIPGKEGSGIVRSIGAEVKNIRVGDRVAFCGGSTGTYAEFVAVQQDQIVLMPASISFETAAAMMLQGLTAYYLSHHTFALNQNQVALIHAGAGGVGLLLIQMAKILKAKVITTVSNEEKEKIVKIAGADQAVIYTRSSFVDTVMEYTKNVGVNVAYDSVGKTTFNDSMASLAIRGMLVSYGQSSGSIPAIEMSKLAEKSLFLTRPTLHHYTNTKAELNSMSAALFDLVEKNKLQITIGNRYSLSEAAKAQSDLEERKTIGKSILII